MDKDRKIYEFRTPSPFRIALMIGLIEVLVCVFIICLLLFFGFVLGTGVNPILLLVVFILLLLSFVSVTLPLFIILYFFNRKAVYENGIHNSWIYLKWTQIDKIVHIKDPIRYKGTNILTSYIAFRYNIKRWFIDLAHFPGKVNYYVIVSNVDASENKFVKIGLNLTRTKLRPMFMYKIENPEIQELIKDPNYKHKPISIISTTNPNMFENAIRKAGQGKLLE